MSSGLCSNFMHRSSGTQVKVTEKVDESSSTSRTREKRIPSYTYDTWRRLRDVCRVVQETEKKVACQKEEVDKLLASEKECRELAEQTQSEKVELEVLRNHVEQQKCHIMTCCMKLIHLNDQKFQKDLLAKKQLEEVAKMQEDLQKRKTVISLTKDNLNLISSHVVWRQRKMINDLMHIYVINLNTPPEARLLPTSCACKSVASIAGLHLPDTLSIFGHSDVEVSAAVGYVVQVLSLLSKIYNLPCQYIMRFYASRSTITDPVDEETYPLYVATRNREKFEEGMMLLNKNLSQLRWSFGLTTRKLDRTLSNLQELILHIVDGRNDALLKATFLRSSSNRNVRNVRSCGKNFTKRNFESSQKIKSPAKLTFPGFSRHASISSNKSSLLFDSSAIAAVTLVPTQQNEGDHAKELSSQASALNSKRIIIN